MSVEEKTVEQLQIKVSAYTKIWQIAITSLQATILGWIALIEHNFILFVLAFLPFPFLFFIQHYERRLEKQLFRELENNARKNLSKKSVIK